MPYARGALVGSTRGTTAAHLARAALEGIAFQVADAERTFEPSLDRGRAGELKARWSRAVERARAWEA